MNYVSDTHALIWWFTDSPKLGARAAEIFAECERGETVVFIPAIVIAETLSIFDKKRVSFDFGKLFKKIHDSENFIIFPLDFPVLQKMVSLKDLPELHDKIIAATAKCLNIPLITKDEILQSHTVIKTVW